MKIAGILLVAWLSACTEVPVHAATGADVPDAAADAADALADVVPAVEAAADASAADAWPGFGCTPGNDKTCNWLPQGIGLAGHCNADGTCTCKPGIGIEQTTGRCYDLTWCDPKFVDSCHGNDTTSAITGVCQPDGTCVCNAGFQLDADGRCESSVCHGGCPTESATRCAGGFLQICGASGNGCSHVWFTTDNCHLEVCNADATKCVPKATTACAATADCPCGCGCSAGKCVCTGATPPNCSHDSDCGPECRRLICTAGSCVAAGAHP